MLWNETLNILKNKMTDITYNTWFKDTKMIDISNGKITIQVPMLFHIKILNENYYDTIEEILRSITGTTYDIEFVDNHKPKHLPPKEVPLLIAGMNLIPPPLPL